MSVLSGREPAHIRTESFTHHIRPDVFFCPGDRTRQKGGATNTPFGTKVLILEVDYLNESGEPTVTAACIRDTKNKYKPWKKFEHMVWIFVDRSDRIFDAEPEIDYEVDCPRCDGSGQMGLVGDFCALCKGDCVVSRDIHDAYLEKHGRE